MTIKETCSCGAMLEVSDEAESYNKAPSAQREFHEAHKDCKKPAVKEKP